MRKNRVVPLAVEGGSLKPNSRHLARTHLDADRILPRIESRLDTQPRRRAGTTNEADDHLAAQQGLSPPVRSDMAKHTMLDLVPFARARREMAYRYMQPRLIGEPLQLCLPQPRTGTVAAAPIGRDERFLGPRIHGYPHRAPPPPDRCDGERAGGMALADADPPEVGAGVGDTGRDGLADPLIDGGIRADPGRRSTA